MRYFHSLLFAVLLTSVLWAQSNPFAPIGREAPLLTLSKGQYPEVFTNDTLRVVCEMVYNRVTGKVEGFLQVDTVFSESGMRPELVSRWLSMDPLAAKYPGLSPYVFVANSPLVTVDPNGGENVVYLVLLNPNSTLMTKKDAASIAALTNARLMSMGLNTRVQVFEGNEPFDPRNLDKTDSFVMFGSTSEIAEAVSGPGFEYLRNAGADKTDLDQLGTNHPEESVKNGPGIFVDESSLSDWANSLKEGKVDLASLVVAHGMGHNAGVKHNSGSLLSWDGGGVSRMLDQPNMYQGDDRRFRSANNPDITRPKDFFGLAQNWDYAKAIKERFGTKEAKDNYSLNKANREKE